VDNLKSKQGMRSSNMQATAATAYVVAFGTTPSESVTSWWTT